MSRAAEHLIERLHRAYEAQEEKNLLGLISPTTIEALELTTLEARVLVALLLARGSWDDAFALLGTSEQKFDATCTSLQGRGLIAHDGSDGYTFEGLVRALRPQDPEETQDARRPTLVLRPLRVRMLLLAQDAETPIRGLARVYSYLFGGEPTKDEWGILGLYVRELGLDRAVQFLVEHAGGAFERPLHELLPLARGIAKGMRPVDGSTPPEEDDWRSQLALEALKKRLVIYKRTADPQAVFGCDYEHDVAEAGRLKLEV